MKKLRLDLERLSVESFSTAATRKEDGTVLGFDVPTPPYASCGCTTGASYMAALCPAPISRTTCEVDVG